MAVHTLVLALEWLRQEDIYEFEVRLVYIVSSRPAKTLSQKTKQKEKKKRKMPYRLVPFHRHIFSIEASRPHDF